MVQKRRRVSYVIPPPTEVPRLLQLPPTGLPRLGSVGPILIPAEGHTTGPQKRDKNPCHRLGVSSLALDTSTQLVGRNAPEGILYSGGRDGMIMSWDLGINMKKRKYRANSADGLRQSHGRWEIMTGWVDHGIDEEGDDADDVKYSDGDILGDVTGSSRKRRQTKLNSIPYEQQWETDIAAFKPGKPAEFRQCVQANMDWINEILLCNYNQTVISASSDGTIKTWSPHSANPVDPTTIGTHTDYVRCLAHSREQNWVASGSFDRTIKLWDLTRSEQQEALVTLNPADATAPKSSVYALAADPFGRTIASGSPERVVRLWDPRTGKRTGKLVGHTENIRAILISDDSKYLLTGSADASIKLWSLSSQRCIHTFTHHTESVWSLHSSHPSLEIFYSGDRSGLVCRVDVENCSDISEGECMLLCQDTDPAAPSLDGINGIVAMDDNLIWTASSRSSIKRWLGPQKRTSRTSTFLTDLDAGEHRRTESPVLFRLKDRVEASSEPSTRPPSSHSPGASNSHDDEMEVTLNGIPLASLVRLVSPNEPFASYSSPRGRDPEVATLYSAASIKSVPRNGMLRSPTQGALTESPLRSGRTEDSMLLLRTSRTMHEERELATSATPLRTNPDNVITGEHGLVRCTILNDRIHALVVDTSGEVAVWDIVRGVCLGRFLREDVSSASIAGSIAGGSSGEHERSPREALETVRERIEGEAVISSWSTADTKAGVLMIHLNERCFEAEIYADEVGFAQDRRFHDESKINVGKWVLRNLFLGFIREEQRTRRAQDDATGNSENTVTPSLRRSTSVNQAELRIDIPHRPASSSPDSSKKHRNVLPSTSVSSPTMTSALPPTAAPQRSSPLLTPMIPLHVQDMFLPLPSIPQSPGSHNADDVTPTPLRARSSTIDHTNPALHTSGTMKESDYFSRARRGSQSGPAPDDLIGPPQTPSTPGGIMGRLKNFGGKMTIKRPPSEFSSFPATSGTVPMETNAAEENLPLTERRVPTPLEVLLSNPLNPPPSLEAPTYAFPLNTAVLISEEASPSFTTVYRGLVASTKHDVPILEEVMPMWLIEYLLMNNIPPLPAPIKISFVLMPWPTKDPEERLPELLNTTQSKLTASRYLRVRKLVVHVQEKLDKITANPRSDPSDEGQESRSLPRAEDVYEILCNDVVMPLSITLAAIRQYVWKQSSELVMYYRRISPPQVSRERRPSG